ncbi:MAG: amidase [Clostridiales bacterium]|nr:amidase [Clostridiales bacterium]
MKEYIYNRKGVIDYAKEWALKRNPKYFNFDNFGGDCTNFASQCIYAGCNVMNYTPTFGWYYNNSSDRTASWTGVEYLYNFLINNKSVGPFAKEISKEEIEIGDIIQLGDSNYHFYHSPVVIKKEGSNIFVAAHSDDTYMRNISSYKFDNIRYIHILGYRK